MPRLRSGITPTLNKPHKVGRSLRVGGLDEPDGVVIGTKGRDAGTESTTLIRSLPRHQLTVTILVGPAEHPCHTIGVANMAKPVHSPDIPVFKRVVGTTSHPLEFARKICFEWPHNSVHSLGSGMPQRIVNLAGTG